MIIVIPFLNFFPKGYRNNSRKHGKSIMFAMFLPCFTNEHHVFAGQTCDFLEFLSIKGSKEVHFILGRCNAVSSSKVSSMPWNSMSRKRLPHEKLKVFYEAVI